MAKGKPRNTGKKNTKHVTRKPTAPKAAVTQHEDDAITVEKSEISFFRGVKPADNARLEAVLDAGVKLLTYVRERVDLDATVEYVTSDREYRVQVYKVDGGERAKEAFSKPESPCAPSGNMIRKDYNLRILPGQYVVILAPQRAYLA